MYPTLNTPSSSDRRLLAYTFNLLAILIFLAANAYPAGIVENFSYSNGALGPASGGAWQLYDGSAGDAAVVNGMARFEDTTDVVRFFPAVLTGAGQTATWSFTIYIAVANTSEGYEISLQPASAPFANGVNYGNGFSIGFDYMTGPTGMSSIQVGEGVPNNTGPIVGYLSAGINHTIAVNMSRGNAATTYTLYLDNSPMATRTFSLTDTRGLNSIEFDQVGGVSTPTGFARIDDIYVAPETATGAMLAFAGAALVSARQRRYRL
jgi:hypothetical protein